MADNQQTPSNTSPTAIPTPSVGAAMISGVRSQIAPVGSSGTDIFAGYFKEEYLERLRGRRGAKMYDEMRRSEPQVAMLMNAIKNAIKGATWEFEPAEQGNEQYQKHADLAEHCFTEEISFEQFKTEALSALDFGFYVGEEVTSVVLNHPRFGSFNGLKALAFRSQKTIERWKVEPVTGKLLAIDQLVWSDVGKNVTMDAEFLVVISLHREGDNYEGISLLRPMFGPWFRKNLYLKLAAIGVEKYAIGTPVGTIPKGKENSDEAKKFEEILQKYTSHEAAYIAIPEGWKIELQKFDFDALKIKELILLENSEMVNAAVANFLLLGSHGSGGSFALGSTLQEFFAAGVQSYANIITDTLNRGPIKRIVDRNFGPQPAYPKIKVSGITDAVGKEIAEILAALVDKSIIRADMPLEEYLRKQYKMPKADPTTVRANPKETVASVDQSDHVIPSGATSGTGAGGQKYQMSEHKIQGRIILDQKYRKQFDDNSETVADAMSSGLTDMWNGLKDDLRSKWNVASAADKIKVPLQVEIGGSQTYRSAIRDALSSVAVSALQGARKEIPWVKNVKLSEKLEQRYLLGAAAKKKGSDYDSLPPEIRKIIDTQSGLIADTQAADLEKAILFQFTSSASGVSSIDEILSDVAERVEPMLRRDSSAIIPIDTAADNATAVVSNGARLAMFFDDDILGTIESFTFTNEDPVSEICQELAGTTWAAEDPDVDRYNPPLHHNCKSRLVPNQKGDPDNPDIDTGGVSLSKSALKSMTLHECCGDHRENPYRLRLAGKIG